MIQVLNLLNKLLADIRECPNVSIEELETFYNQKEESTAAAYAAITKELTEVELPEDLFQVAFLPGRLIFTWQSSIYPDLRGEVSLRGIYDTLTKSKLEIYYDDSDGDEEERIKNEYLAKGYAFDFPSRLVGWDTGAILIWEEGKMKYPEVWVMDEYEKFFPLKLDLGTYFEALYLTKGFIFWHCLYLAPEHYKELDFATRDRFEKGYPLLKSTFTAQDYTELDKLFNELNINK